MSRPSENLPVDLLKKVSPFGNGSAWKAAAKPPVSALEAPKLNMAGQSKRFVADIGAVVHKISTIKDTSGMWLRNSIGAMNFMMKHKWTNGIIIWSYHAYQNLEFIAVPLRLFNELDREIKVDVWIQTLTSLFWKKRKEKKKLAFFVWLGIMVKLLFFV